MPYTVWHLLTSSRSKQSSHLPMESVHPAPSPLRVCATAWNILIPNASVAGTCTSFRTQLRVNSSRRNFLTVQNRELPSPHLYQTDHFLLLFSDYEAQLVSLFLFVQLYLCISRASPIRMSTQWQQEIWLSCSLLHLKHSTWHNIRMPTGWIELWRMNGWICKWVCKLRAKKTSSGRKYVLTVTCRRVSQHF